MLNKKRLEKDGFIINPNHSCFACKNFNGKVCVSSKRIDGKSLYTRMTGKTPYEAGYTCYDFATKGER